MRCKMRLIEIGRTASWQGVIEGARLKFVVVGGDGSPENKEFFKYTPSGSIELAVVNDTVVQQLELGAEYYVDFTKAAK